ncbi:DUF3572 domain-containing protein [Sphingobium sp. AN641]|uniref:DUF3572 domain-containing protein n=1 Tax=Sphingobium sp. AN641 TaxID=3133443 RepID=UPI0030BB41E0
MRPQGQNGKGADAPDRKGEAETLALMALGWTLADAARADRLLALTGLDADTLRGGIGDAAVLSAVLAFLADHEPDLIACAADVGASPEALIAARDELTT